MDLDMKRCLLSDECLNRYFKFILKQLVLGYRTDYLTLLKYVNEMEYRGLKYRIRM